MCFKPKFLRNIQVPKFQLDCEKLKYVTVHKYLGCFIHNQLCDNDDIKRQMRSTYARDNLIIKRFRHCTDDVKVKLFKSYCCNFYGICLWSKYTQECRKKLITAFKRIFRGLFNCDKYNTTVTMINMHVDPFIVIERKLVFGFRNRVFLSDNSILSAITDCNTFHRSSLNLVWNLRLF